MRHSRARYVRPPFHSHATEAPPAQSHAPHTRNRLGLMLTRTEIAKPRALAVADLRSVASHGAWLVACDLDQPVRRRSRTPVAGARPADRRFRVTAKLRLPRDTRKPPDEGAEVEMRSRSGYVGERSRRRSRGSGPDTMIDQHSTEADQAGGARSPLELPRIRRTTAWSPRFREAGVAATLRSFMR